MCGQRGRTGLATLPTGDRACDRSAISITTRAGTFCASGRDAQVCREANAANACFADQLVDAVQVARLDHLATVEESTACKLRPSRLPSLFGCVKIYGILVAMCGQAEQY
jgi:hypothetical protein